MDQLSITALAIITFLVGLLCGYLMGESARGAADGDDDDERDGD